MNTSSPIATITLDILPNGKVEVWTQKKSVLTREQEQHFNDWLRKVNEMKDRMVRQLSIADG